MFMTAWRKNIFFERENIIFSLSRYVTSCFRKYKKQDISDVFPEMKCEEFTVLSGNIAVKHCDSLDIEIYLFLYARCIFFSTTIFPKIKFVYCIIENAWIWQSNLIVYALLLKLCENIYAFNERLIKRDQPSATVISDGACIYCLPIYACQSSKRSFAKEKYIQATSKVSSLRKQSLRQ